MNKYKVIVISVALKNNRVAKYGEIVNEIAFTSNPVKLEQLGYIELVKEVQETKELKSKK